jgi:hypothetical protein
MLGAEIKLFTSIKGIAKTKDQKYKEKYFRLTFFSTPLAGNLYLP